ncbi:MAG: hypothetical protein Q9163_005044, partial [Psora crenata]
MGSGLIAKQTAVVLTAVEDTLKSQNYDFTPTAYFAALLALLSQSVSPANGIVNKELATSVVYLLDVVATYVPSQLLRSKFEQILHSLAPVLTSHDIEAPLIRSSIGCLESLLLAQDSAAWALSQTQISPRRAIAGLLVLTQDHRPKVRKRAQEAITHVLKTPPPSPSLDHPAADMCAETALKGLRDMLAASATLGKRGKRDKRRGHEEHQPGTMHALQLVKSIASASGGWPSKKIEALCEVLMRVSRSNNEWLAMTAFEIFEVIFTGMADQVSSAKLPKLMHVIEELKPAHNDERLLPPWIAVLSRGYVVSSQIEPQETFQKLPEVFETVAGFLASSWHNIRVSASDCLVSFLVNCLPDSIILDPSVYDGKVLEKIAKSAIGLLSLKYQSAWMELFNVLSAMFTAYRWRSVDLLNEVVKIVGELRENESFAGKKQADHVLGRAIEAMGPEAILQILPLSLVKPVPGQPGRAWLLPILRDHVRNTNLAHFRSELVPLSETLFQRVIDHGRSEKTMEIKIYETLVQQIWAVLPGYCYLPLDLTKAFDQSFAEMLANLLYTQTELRADICKALQTLVESNQAVAASEASEQELLLRHRMTKAEAQTGLNHLATFAGNVLAVLFNVYSQTLPQYRGYILQCISAYLSITPEKDLLETFNRVTGMLEALPKDLPSETQAEKLRQPTSSTMPPTSHTLMDLVIALSIYLPRSTFPTLFSLAGTILPQSSDPQLQKKAYKLLPRLATSPNGALALQERNADLQTLLLSTAASASAPARRDRLAAMAVVIEHISQTDLYFIPSILSEVVLACKEVNEKARTTAFDLLVLMAYKMSAGGTITQSRIPHMDSSAPVVEASLEEFFTMVSAGLVGSTPHMISASITALTRILYEFVSRLPHAVIEDLVQTMDLFLTSTNREIVRSVLGFVKVAIISLPEEIVKPRLQTLIPGLMGWSKEHKAQFRAKVKHILERAMRRFGPDLVEKYCPEEDKKLIHNIRKTRERRKRKKDVGGGADTSDTGPSVSAQRKGRFESEYDEALYGSDDSASGSENASSDGDVDGGGGKPSKHPGKGKSRAGGTYISETNEEPLDLLDRRALGHISNRKPDASKKNPGLPLRKNKGKVNVDGKLVFDDQADDEDEENDYNNNNNNDDHDHDAMVLDGPEDKNTRVGHDDGLGGVGAYVDAISGRDAVQRGRGGRLKYSNRRVKDGDRTRVEMDRMDLDGGDHDDHHAGGQKRVRFEADGG